MIVTPKDVADLQAALERHAISSKWIVNMHRALDRHGPSADPAAVAQATWEGLTPEELAAARAPQQAKKDNILEYLRRNLHLFIPCGFDEVRISALELEVFEKAMGVEFRKRFPDGPAPDWFGGAKGAPLALSIGFQCRDERSGMWYSNLSLDNATQSLSVRSVLGNKRSITLSDVLDKCADALRAPGHAAAMVLPNLWRPPDAYPCIELVDSTREILTALKAHETRFSSLTWQQLEDVVAELLRRRGLEVHVTPRRKDGGRDLVARGELIPGEPSVLAVEIKHKAVVKLDDVRSRLQANREFPALMFATSGRFSAGVLSEKQKPENFLRLWLRDGEALSAWVKEHG